MEKTVENYDKFFDEQQKDLNERLDLLKTGDSFWKVIESFVDALENEDKYLWQCQSGEISQKQYSAQKVFQENATILFDQLILWKSREYRERGLSFPVSPMSSKKEKTEFAKALLKEHRPSDHENEFLMGELKSSIDHIMNLTIGKTAPYIPKADLRYNEYLAIKNEFTASELERDFKGTSLLVSSHLVLMIIAKGLRRAKML